MNDRELLELAAKAAGLSGWVYEPAINGMLLPPYISHEGAFKPLTDDGDALRLAVVCQLGISIVGGRAGLVDCVSFKDCHGFVSSREIADDGDLMEATRRAITRCAAEYQLRKEKQK